MARRSGRWLMLFGAIATLFLVAVPAQATHVRPKSASPVRFSLVPAFNQCTAANRTHGPPLAFPACNPPAQSSAQAAMGTPDAFGGTANFVGYLRVYVIVGVPGPPDDSDVPVRLSLADVRCVPSGARCGGANSTGPADYSGEVGFEYTVRFTDHYNAVAPGRGTDPATVVDTTISGSVPCVETASTSTGSACDLYTTYNVIHPGLIKDSKRMVEQIDDVHVYDGGADGIVSTTADNTVFLRSGIFIP